MSQLSHQSLSPSKITTVLVCLCLSLLSFFPIFVSAIPNIGAFIDAQCTAHNTGTPCHGPLPAGAAWGTCGGPGDCVPIGAASTIPGAIPAGAAPSSGLFGGLSPYLPSATGLSQGIITGVAIGGTMMLLQKLMQPDQKGNNGGYAGGSPTGAPTCTAYYQVSTPSADPCAYYVPSTSNLPLSGPGNISDQLLNSLGSGANVSSNVLSQTGSGAQNNSAAATTSLPTPVLVNLQPGVQGDIQFQGSGATILANNRQNGTEVAGFYGGDAFAGQPQGVVANLCATRPWASNVLSYVIPPSFFDGLCSLRGYQVGTPPPPQVALTQTSPQPRNTATTTTAPPTSTIPPRVEIWAVPASVILGARTSIFWNTQGVTSCTETSPDGSFNQSSLYGTAATVALTGATTFTISCLAPDGSPVTNYVTVDLKI